MERALGNAAFDPLYIDPQMLATLQPNQLLDEDATTMRRVTFVGPQGNLATFSEQSPLEQNTYSFDLRTGVLTTFESRTREGAATNVTRMQLTKPPGN